jgi:hypothetical protein
MTIFGFNTDVTRGDTVYHVQSEAKPHDLLLQTLVFVKGQCVGKRTYSYAHKVMQPDFSTEAMHELLKFQHKTAIDDIQAGVAPTSNTEVQDVGGTGLALTLVSSDQDGYDVHLSLLVTNSGAPVANAQVNCWFYGKTHSSPIAQAQTGSSGQVGLDILLTEDIGRESALMLRATSGGKSATRKIRLKR